jgi:hypothetical protein
LIQRLIERPIPLHVTHLDHRNYINVTLTLHAIEVRTAQSSGLPWVTGRAFLPQGKDATTGHFRPAKWYTLKAYCLHDDSADPVVDLLSQLRSYLGITYLVKLEVTGHTEYREWTAASGSGSEDIIIIETIPLFIIEQRPS